MKSKNTQYIEVTVENLKQEYEKIIKEVVDRLERESKTGLETDVFDNLSTTPDNLVALLNSEAFELNGTFYPFYNEAETLKISVVIDKYFFKEDRAKGVRGFFQFLKVSTRVINEKSATPLRVQNFLTEILKIIDCNTAIAVLYLRGLMAWFEASDVPDPEPQYSSAMTLYNWVREQYKIACVFYLLTWDPCGEYSKIIDSIISESSESPLVWLLRPKEHWIGSRDAPEGKKEFFLEKEGGKSLLNLIGNGALVDKCLDVLRQANPNCIDINGNYIGGKANKGIVFMWFTQLGRISLIKDYGKMCQKDIVAILNFNFPNLDIQISTIKKLSNRAQDLENTVKSLLKELLTATKQA